jgi:hypothetical protein
MADVLYIYWTQPPMGHTGTEHGIGCTAKTLPPNMNFQKLAIFLNILQIYKHTHIQ